MSDDVRLSADQARAMAVSAQGVPGGCASPTAALRRTALMQMDPLTRVAKAHLLTCAARLPAEASVGAVAAELWGREARTFETYTHAACILPIEDWPLFEIHRRRARARPDAPPAALARRVLETIAASEAGLTVRELQQGESPAASWGWSQTRRAAEHLVWRGELACTDRRRGERVLDLAERRIPAHLLAQHPSDAECLAGLVERALGALGVATAEDVAAYHHLGPEAVAAALARAGYARARVNGWTDPAWVSPAPGPGHPRADDPRLIGPLDTLIRDRDRTRRLFGFDYVFEAYKPAAKRRYGHYVLALLDGTTLTARVDAHRDADALVVDRLFTEPGTAPDRARDCVLAATTTLAGQLGLGFSVPA
ncbi:winged helix DNA-binding domain-containing protein [Georgenia sp. TF02-10]|uniref:DNA glycosylase AlkZ-like family protein n=1 Tax=Georgenia sp. TF02-10 TaxID=2917725 RepID=UPI001FA764E7|nr:crosslink repair DNA glycosylase YcaQ family protein [Georgenia sp. TF02-10]UNX55061.1 winged helix DNA-binding domain-containing protein [Georgenia sp. TF02-10]